MNNLDKYYYITTVLHFRQTYAIPENDVLNLAEDDEEIEETIQRLIGTEAVNDLSQFVISEDVVNTDLVDINTLKDKLSEDENCYISSWTTEKLKTFCNNWKIE